MALLDSWGMGEQLESTCHLQCRLSFSLNLRGKLSVAATLRVATPGSPAHSWDSPASSSPQLSSSRAPHSLALVRAAAETGPATRGDAKPRGGIRGRATALPAQVCSCPVRGWRLRLSRCPASRAPAAPAPRRTPAPRRRCGCQPRTDTGGPSRHRRERGGGEKRR